MDLRRPLLLALLAAACGGGSQGDATGGSGETEGDAMGTPPAFTSEAGDVITITADRVEPLALDVRDVELGRTQFLLDGAAVVLAGSESPEASLDERELVLSLRGGMATGEHRIEMVTPSSGGVLRSRELTLLVEPATPRSPVAQLDDAVVATGTRLWSSGDGNRSLLAVLDPSSEPPSLRLIRGAGSGFIDESRSVELPELVSDGALRPSVAAGLTVNDADEGGNRLRIVWVAGPDRRMLRLVDDDWDALVGVEPIAAVEPADLPAAAEWAQLGTPAVLGDTLVVELIAPLDVEASRPGDHGLLYVRLVGDEPEPPARLDLGRPLDLDQLGPGVDLLRARDGRRALGVRFDGARPWTLEAPRAGEPGGARLRLAAGEVEAAPYGVDGSLVGLATVVGSLASRSALAVRTGGGLRGAIFDGLSGPRRARAPDGDAPSSGASGPPAATLLAGTPTFLVPHGGQAEVSAVLGDGEALRIVPVPGLSCDEVALHISEPANENGTTGLACLLDGEVRLGTLTLEPAD